MRIYLLVNNSTSVSDTTPAKIFTKKEEAIKELFDYEQKSVFKQIVLYEYVLDNGSATYPSFFYRVKREYKSIVEGLEQFPVNHKEFRKNHPFIFDKFESFQEPTNGVTRYV